MRFTGRLREWNEERGYGFIRPSEGGDDVFVHVSALPSPRPGSAEELSFEVALDRQGRKKAVSVRRMADEAAALAADRAREGGRQARSPRAPIRRRSGVGIASGMGVLVLLAALGWFGYGAGGERVAPDGAGGALLSTRTRTVAPSSFTCDGRKYCSQMHSCEEAKFFLQNCPGTEMDGDHDGIPCEQQLCSSWWR